MSALTGATLIMPRCNPYGHETGGPKRLLGGLYGPEYEGDRKWHCDRKAEGRYRMICRCGHVGQAMPLCGPGLVRNATSGAEYRHPGHVAQIQQRAAGLCPRCAYPQNVVELAQLADRAQWEYQRLASVGLGLAPAAQRYRQAMEAARGRLDALRLVGVIHNCPLVLREVS
jgi:hypothetical protein